MKKGLGIGEKVPVWKYALDYSCILLALPFALPAMIVIAAYIKAVSKGPIFFQQERIGFRGRHFLCYKFRSMKSACDQSVHLKHVAQLIHAQTPMTKIDSKGDSRLIPFGWLLRATGLDELPQLINIALGDMSLVGPRPCLPFEYDLYLPWQKERFNTLPGLTGLWQVSGKNHTTFTQMMELDIHYTRHKTVWMDLTIILKTIPAMYLQTCETNQQRTVSVPAISAKPAAPSAAAIVAAPTPSPVSVPANLELAHAKTS